MPDTAPDQFFTDSMRAMQDHFDSRRLADRVIELSRKREIGDKEKAMILGGNAVKLFDLDRKPAAINTRS